MQADLDSSPRTADWWHTPTKHLLTGSGRRQRLL